MKIIKNPLMVLIGIIQLGAGTWYIVKNGDVRLGILIYSYAFGNFLLSTA